MGIKTYQEKNTKPMKKIELERLCTISSYCTWRLCAIRPCILKSSNSNTYYSQGAFGPTLVPEKCKYLDCDSNSNHITVGGVPHVVNLPEGLQSWVKSYMSSPSNQDRESGDLDFPIQLYAMQPQRPCSNATGRVLVNVIPVCEECNEDNDEDPCHQFRGSSYDWSKPLHYGQGSNYLVEDTTGGGFMSKKLGQI